jgi:COP9 signalosome complex subunit 5
MSSSTALKTFSLTNDIQTLSAQDDLFKYDKDKDKAINNQAPWRRE